MKKALLFAIIGLSLAACNKNSSSSDSGSSGARGVGISSATSQNTAVGIIGTDGDSNMTSWAANLITATIDPQSVIGSQAIQGVRFKGSVPLTNGSAPSAEVYIDIYPNTSFQSSPFTIHMIGATVSYTNTGSSYNVSVRFEDGNGSIQFDGGQTTGTNAQGQYFSGTLTYKNKTAFDNGNPAHGSAPFNIVKCGFVSCQ